MLWRQKMLKEFKDFAMRGNVFDMAIGIIIGAAFGAIVTSFVDDLLMPPIGMLLGGVDFTNLFFSLDGQQYASLAEAQLAGAATINYGLFLSTVIDFLIVAFVIFLLVRQINRLKAEPEEVSAEPTTKDCLYCATEIPIQATRCPHCTSEI
jgi:large conductance mechanosensitive channel